MSVSRNSFCCACAKIMAVHLQGAELIVVTDYSPSTFSDEMKVLLTRLARWAEKLSRLKSPGNINLAGGMFADPLCRMRMVAGQVVCCALGVACTSKADDGSGIISHIKAGYDAYFAVRKKHEKVCTQRWCVLQGAVVVPDVQAIKIKKMKDLQDFAFADHGGFRTVKNVHYLHW